MPRRSAPANPARPVGTPRTAAVAAALAAAVALLATACGSSAPSGSSDTPTVVATTSIWADVVANVACDGSVDVQTIIPVGADPHAFEASPRDRERMDRAALVVANGGGLEEGLTDTLDASEHDGTTVFRMTDHLQTRSMSATDAAHGDGDQHAGDADPHVWFDPTLVSSALPALADALVAQAGMDRATVDRCVADYQAQLADLDRSVADRIDQIPAARRVLVTDHDALGYYAARYGLKVVGTVIPSTSSLAEANPSDLADLADTIERTGVPAIFGETQHPADVANALADRVGHVEVVELYTGTLGEAGSGADTYVGLIRTDTERIASALG